MAKEQPKPTKTKGSECPWCNYENTDEKKGLLHSKEDSKLEQTLNGNYQCSTCGKIWASNALGQPWTMALEMGPAWEREYQGRKLAGG